MTKKDFEACTEICASIIWLTRKRARKEIILNQFTFILEKTHDNFDIMKFTVRVHGLLENYAADKAIDEYAHGKPHDEG